MVSACHCQCPAERGDCLDVICSTGAIRSSWMAESNNQLGETTVGAIPRPVGWSRCDGRDSVWTDGLSAQLAFVLFAVFARRSGSNYHSAGNADGNAPNTDSIFWQRGIELHSIGVDRVVPF